MRYLDFTSNTFKRKRGVDGIYSAPNPRINAPIGTLHNSAFPAGLSNVNLKHIPTFPADAPADPDETGDKGRRTDWEMNPALYNLQITLQRMQKPWGSGTVDFQHPSLDNVTAEDVANNYFLHNTSVDPIRTSDYPVGMVTNDPYQPRTFNSYFNDVKDARPALNSYHNHQVFLDVSETKSIAEVDFIFWKIEMGGLLEDDTFQRLSEDYNFKWTATFLYGDNKVALWNSPDGSSSAYVGNNYTFPNISPWGEEINFNGPYIYLRYNLTVPTGAAVSEVIIRCETRDIDDNFVAERYFFLYQGYDSEHTHVNFRPQPSLDDYAKDGEKPTFFQDGLPVDKVVINKTLYETESLSFQLETSDDLSFISDPNLPDWINFEIIDQQLWCNITNAVATLNQTVDLSLYNSFGKVNGLIQLNIEVLPVLPAVPGTTEHAIWDVSYGQFTTYPLSWVNWTANDIYDYNQQSAFVGTNLYLEAKALVYSDGVARTGENRSKVVQNGLNKTDCTVVLKFDGIENDISNTANWNGSSTRWYFPNIIPIGWHLVTVAVTYSAVHSGTSFNIAANTYSEQGKTLKFFPAVDIATSTQSFLFDSSNNSIVTIPINGDNIPGRALSLVVKGELGLFTHPDATVINIWSKANTGGDNRGEYVIELDDITPVSGNNYELKLIKLQGHNAEFVGIRHVGTI